MNNEEFIEHYNKEENKLIMYKASQKYKKLLTKDEIKSCQMCGLWYSLSYYNPKKSKFSTFLYNRVQWECLAEINKKFDKCKNVDIICDISDKHSDNNIINDITDKNRKLLEKRYIFGMTFIEIGKSEKCSHETARKRIKTALREVERSISG